VRWACIYYIWEGPFILCELEIAGEREREREREREILQIDPHLWLTI
jgi:hypothetical protein